MWKKARRGNERAAYCQRWNWHMNRRGPVARVTRGSSGPALPCRVSHGDVTIYCQSWTGLWPMGQRHQRVQPVPLPPHPPNLFAPSFIRCCLAPAFSFAVPFLSLGLHSAQPAGGCRSHLSQVSQWGMKLIRARGTTGHHGHYFSRAAVVKVLLVSEEHVHFIRVAGLGARSQ